MQSKRLLYAVLFVSVGAITSSWFSVRWMETHLIEAEAEDFATKWATFLRARLPNLKRSLETGEFTAEDREIVNFAVEAGHMFRYKFFGPDGTIVFASRPEDIGKVNNKWYFSELVKNGTTYSKIEDDEDFGTDRKVVSEAYAPVMEDDRFAGAVEVYTDVTHNAETLRNLGDYALSGLLLLFGIIGAITSSFVYWDIRDRQRVAKQLATAKEDADAVNRAKSDFLATMSHEIRTPLNGVIPMTGLLLDTELDEKQRSYANTVHESGRALLDIINDILDLSKLEAGRVELESVPVEVAGIVEGVADLLGAKAGAKDLEISLFVDPEVPRTLIGDGTRLRQVLLNLVGNAIKFTEAGGVSIGLTGETRADGSFLTRFEVTDTGIGIAQEHKAKIFENFSQADASTTRRFGGTGLGLAICRQLVDIMGGDIGVDSAPGEGSTFWFTARLEAGSPAVADASASQGTLSNLRVLVVDDLELNRLILGKQTAAWGVQVQSVESGHAAVTALRDAAQRGAPYHVAFIDHMMPEMDGIELAMRLRDDAPLSATKLVLTSSGLLPDQETRAKLPNINAYLNKPIGPSKLKACLLEVGQAMGSEAGAQSPTHHARTEDAPTRSLRVLVAEDNKINQKLMAAVLERLGHRADVVGNGTYAVAAVKKNAYDVVLMDVHMPELDGVQTLSIIRGLNGPVAETPIVAVTADAMQGDREKYMALGFADYVSKPIDRDRLRQALAKCSRRWLDKRAAPGMARVPLQNC